MQFLSAHVPCRHADAEDLVATMEDLNLSNTLPPGTITFKEGNGRSTIDLCLIIMGLVEKVISSDISQDLDHNTYSLGRKRR
jgi:hypothetical protein